MAITTVVTRREDGIDHNVRATTPASVPNVIFKALTPARIVATRALRVYLQTLVGLLSATGTIASGIIPARDFWDLLLKCAGLSIAAAVMSALQNTVELLTKLDETNPELRA